MQISWPLLPAPVNTLSAGHGRLGVAGHEAVGIGVGLQGALDHALRAGDIVRDRHELLHDLGAGAPARPASSFDDLLMSSTLIEPSPLPMYMS